MRSSIEILKSAVPLEAVIGAVIELKNGRGLCPFHEDRIELLAFEGGEEL